MADRVQGLIDTVVAAARAVHGGLGPGFLESIYESALALELRDRGLTVRRQHRVPVRYDGRIVGHHRLDLFVADALVVEIKAVKELTAQQHAAVSSYLRTLGRTRGLLINFARPDLEVRQVFLEETADLF